MAVFTVECSGSQWQDDFERLIPGLERLFGRYFHDWNDKEEIIHNAVLMFMVRFAKKWTKGETIKLTTNYVVLAVRGGQRFMKRPMGRHGRKSVKAVSNRTEQLARIKARVDRMLSWVDYRLVLETLSETESTAIQMVIAGYSVNEVSKAIGTNWLKARQILKDVLARLNA